MTLDFNKLKKDGNKISEQLKQEYFSELPTETIHLLNNEVINHVLHSIRTSKRGGISARVLNNWIDKNVIVLDDSVQGKVKRFDKIQCIWLNIIEAARKFNVHLEDLATAHQRIMTSEIKNFNYLKLAVINTILNKSHILEIKQDGGMSIELENEYIASLSRGNLIPHIVLPLNELISKEFPKANFSLPIQIKNITSDEQKSVLLFLLKTLIEY